MNGVADNAVGAILEIPAQALQKIDEAEKAIKQLGATSTRVARSVRKDWGEIALTGLDAFIKKVKETERGLGKITMPTLDATGFASSISQIAQAMSAMGQSSVDGMKNFGKIANSIAKLSAAQPSAQMFQEIANGITAIGNTSQQTIQNVSQLAQAMAQLARDIRTVQNAQSTQTKQSATISDTTKNSVSEITKLYKEQANILLQQNQLKARAKTLTENEQKQLQALIARYSEIQKRIADIRAEQGKSASAMVALTGGTVSADRLDKRVGAIKFAQQAKSLKELQEAYKNLKTVMGSIDPKSTEWRKMNSTLQQTKGKIDEIRRGMGEFKAQSVNVAGVVGQLRNQLAAVFSIAAITGFIKKMVDVRAQFELQNVALRAILQNKDEADKIFMQVQQMALQSPFNIMELNTYTKQLAAYRIESEKLVGTTKMLADVSAGLGVDMGRLILAYGQVKSANYLRATEIRQFTEAGLNIAGELAQYFSELQGKMVSVGDVMEMVTKRMVRFEDVEEVFKRVTSAGGLFYDMQKKQSETLRGQMLRIKDAMDIMMNEIGKSNQGVISGALSLIRELISNWRKILPLVYAFAAALSVGALTKGLISVVLSLKKVITLLRTAKTAQDAWNIAAQKNVWGAVLGIITAVVVELWAAKNATSALADELDRIRKESATDLKESVADFYQLAKTATDATKSYTERKEALDALNRSYKEILPSYMLESEWLQKNIGNYDAAIAKIQEYFQAKEMQKQIDAILNSEEYEKAVKDMQNLGEKMLNEGLFDATVTKKYTDAWMQQIASEIASGKIENSAEAVSKRLSEIFGKDIIISDSQFKSASKHFKELDSQINHIALGTAFAKDQAEFFGKELERLSTGQLQSRIADARKEMEELNNAIAVEQRFLSAGVATRSDKRASEVKIQELEERYNQLTVAVAQYEQAQAGAWGRETSAKIEEQIGSLEKEIRAYSELLIQRNELARTNTGTESENKRLAELNEKLSESETATINLANSMGAKLNPEMLASTDDLFELERLLHKVAQEAYPELAKKSVEEVAKGEVAIKSLVDKVDWLKRAINSLSSGLGFGAVFEDMMTETDTKAEEAEKESKRLKELEKERHEQYIKNAAERAGVDAKRLKSNKLFIKEEGQSNSDMAKSLREQAKSWKDQQAAVADMTEEARKFYFESESLTQARVDELARMADAAEDYANALSPEALKKTEGGKGGTDPWIEVFKEREKAVQDFYKQYETLREKFSESESQRRAIASFEPYFESVGLNMADVISKGWDTRGLVSNIEQLQAELKKHFGAIYDDAEKIMRKGLTLDVVENPTAEQKLAHALAKLIQDLEKQAADNRIKIDFEIQDQAIESLKKSITEMFDNYELTKELSKLGVSVDLTYMVGGRPTTLADLRKKYEELMEGFASKSEEEQKIIKKMGEDLTKKEYDNRKQQLINYNKFLLESMSERVQIQMKAQREISRLSQDETLDETTRMMAIQRERENLKKDLASQQWKEFQGSDLYIQLFDNIEQASTQSINYVLGKLKELRASLTDLPPDQLKAIMKQIDKLETQANTRNPFAALRDNIGDAIKALKELGAAEKAFQDANERYETAKKTRDDYAAWTSELEQQLSIERAKLGVNEFGEQVENDITRELQKQIKLRREQLGLMNENVDALDKEKNQRAEEVSALKKAKEAAKQAFQAIGGYAQEVSSSIGAIASSLENVFGAMSDGTRDTVESIQEILGGVGDMASGVLRAIANPADIGAYLQALKGLAATVGSIFAIGDKKKEREIQRLTEKVETLDKAYQRLEKSIEKAYTFSDYNAGYKQMQRTLEAEKRAYEEMIRLEEAKKKSDDEKIKEYKEKLQDIADAQEELRKQMLEDMGSTTDYRGAAEGFVSAWLDAYKETGDGLDALNDKWDEFIQNMFVKQAAMAKAGDIYKNVIDIFNKALDEGKRGEALQYAIDEAEKAAADANEYMNMYLKGLADIFHIKPSGTGELILSDLQKGIQNITEPQAAAIEAYLNSMRFAVFEHTRQLDTLIATIQQQYGSGAENPVVTELKGIRGVLDNIYKDLHSVVKSSVGKTYIQVG